MPVDPSAVDRLLALGRRQGFVTTSQIDRELPVDRLSEAEIAEIVDRLERAGVPVELDEGLSTERPDSPPDSRDGPPVIRLRNDDGPNLSPPPPRPHRRVDTGPDRRNGTAAPVRTDGTGTRPDGRTLAAILAAAACIIAIAALLFVTA
jgi:hypothetical protein